MKRTFLAQCPRPSPQQLGRWSPTLQENPKMALTSKTVSQMITSVCDNFGGGDREEAAPLQTPPTLPHHPEGLFSRAQRTAPLYTHDIASLRSYINVADTVLRQGDSGGYRGQSPRLPIPEV
ncbi:hypothetical protein FKM82_028691 [Ascaphus truei]